MTLTKLLTLLVITLLSFKMMAGGDGTTEISAKSDSKEEKNPSTYVASAEEIDFAQKVIDQYAQGCLISLDSKFEINRESQDYRSKINVEIIRSIELKRASKGVASVSSIKNRECVAYANDTDNEIIKNIIFKKKELKKEEQLPSGAFQK